MVALSKSHRCTKICRFLNWYKYASMGLSSKTKTHPTDTKASERRLSFGLKDVLDWSEMSRCHFFKIPSRVLPGDVLNTSLGRLEMSSRLFLVKATDHQSTIYGSSIYVRFETTYILPLHH